MHSANLLQQTKLAEALVALKEEVRNAPANVDGRVRLFALNCILGKWDKAEADLNSIKALDSSWSLPAQVYHALIRMEQQRAAVFSGAIKPLVMGEPEEWLAWNIMALEMDGQGRRAEAADLRRKAWEASPAYGCALDGRTCEWISDCDRRIGPALEACLDGSYYWIPFGRLKKIAISQPEFMVETVWVPATLTVQGGAELSAQLPARYPGTESAADPNICLGKSTEWICDSEGVERPLGQKMFESQSDFFGLLGCRVLEFA